jgi:tetratricopeptide (TPR) repeat protein
VDEPDQVGGACVQPAYRERPHARLRRLQGRTHGFAAGDANLTTRAWLVALEAHALAGREAATLRALDQAERIVGGAGEEHAARRPRAAFFNRAYLMGERGVALSRLGRSADARDVLEAALQSLSPEMVKTRPRLLSALATAHVHEGNVDEACRLGADALALADRQQVMTNVQDVRRLRLDVEPWRDTQPVRELDEQLATVGSIDAES